MNRRFCLTLNLKKDPDLIRQYEEYHQRVWPEILRSIRDAGIEEMQIYRYGTRLFMIMEVNDSFSFGRKKAADLANEKVQQWEELMWKYQEAVEGAGAGEKWVLMDKIFDLHEA